MDDEEVPDGAVHILHSDGSLHGEVFGHLDSHLGATIQPLDFGVMVVLGIQVAHSINHGGLVVLVEEVYAATEGVL